MSWLVIFIIIFFIGQYIHNIISIRNQYNYVPPAAASDRGVLLLASVHSTSLYWNLDTIPSPPSA